MNPNLLLRRLTALLCLCTLSFFASAQSLLPATTTITTSKTPASYGQSIVLTATVTGSGATPSGQVVFYDGSATLATRNLVNGATTFSTSTMTAGTHKISISYSGNATYSPGVSDTLVQIITLVVPVVTSLAPAKGNIGTSVTVTGQNFNSNPTSNNVYFGAVRAPVLSGSSTSLVVNAPSGANFKQLSVIDTVSGLTGVAPAAFIPTFPSPTGTVISPAFYSNSVSFSAASNVNKVAFADLDGDGRPDMVSLNPGNRTMFVYFNNGTSGPITTASFSAPISFAISGTPVFLAISDVDGDGRPDLLVSNALSVTIFRNLAVAGALSTASFAAPVGVSVGTSAIALSVADITLDGRPDIIVCGTAGVRIFRNTCTKGVIDATTFAAGLFISSGTATLTSMLVRDVDGDGKCDIVTTSRTDFLIARNTNVAGTAFNINSFDPIVTVNTVASSISCLSIADVDGDGKPDLIAVSRGDGFVEVVKNNSTPGNLYDASFENAVPFTVSAGSADVVVADADGDGKPDIITGNGTSNSISVLKNTSTTGAIDAGSFDNAVDFAAGAGAISIDACDINGDGIPDIAVANNGSASVTILQATFSTLPVTVTRFSAVREGNTAKIKWSVQNELGITKYEVERSADGIRFTRPGTVPALADGRAHDYNFNDAGLQNGAYYYRLKIYETNGSFSYSNVVKLYAGQSGSNAVTISPNPASGKAIVVKLDLPAGNYTAVLFDGAGREVLKQQITYAGGSGTYTLIPAKQLASGVYFLNVVEGNEKFVRQVRIQ